MPTLANAAAIRDADVFLFVCSSVCPFVSLSIVKFVKSFARWQYLAASVGLSVSSPIHLLLYKYLQSAQCQ